MTIIDRKCRLCRREKTKLFLKGARCLSPKCPIDKKGAVPPGIHGLGRSFRSSAYAKQLRAKQKAKRIYGLSETVFRNYVKKASNSTKETGQVLLELLETRLDNIVYRLGLAPSRATARQMVRHSHILVNGKKLTIPSYFVRLNEEITLSERARKIEKFKTYFDSKTEVPAFLERDGLVGKLVKMPAREQVLSEIDEALIIEYYSR